MKRTFFLLSILARSVFALLFLFDFLLIAKIGGELATNGVKGVKDWILHAGSMGKIIIESSGPDSMAIHFPPSGPNLSRIFHNVWCAPRSNRSELLVWSFVWEEGAPIKLILYN